VGCVVTVEVVQVGDGACTILGEATAGIAILDCGTRGAPASKATEALLRSLDGREEQIQALIVSHYDLDHWGGLRVLADYVAPLTTPLQIYYPNVFASGTLLRSAILALISLDQRTGVKALDLANAWRSTGRDVQLRPLCAGQTFDAGGRNWRVVWPPSAHAPAELRSTRDAFHELLALAQELADAGHSRLLTNILDAYALEAESTDSRATDPSTDDGELPAVRRMPEEESNSDASNPPSDQDGLPARQNERWGFGDVPLRFRLRLRQLATRVQRLSNAMSLVIEASDGTVVAFGDCEGPALGRATAALSRGHYSVMLAPHHGTHSRFNNLPAARICISQQGEMNVRLGSRHRNAHRLGGCVTTYGKATIPLL
jgi:beta-lactamase superfamily II metal-dependent hydrolase